MPNTILICRHNKNGTGYCECLGEYCVEGPCTAEELIEYAPVRHGRWKECWDDAYLTYSHKCSLCGEFPLTKEETMHDEVLSKYCPNCGACMDKEE